MFCTKCGIGLKSGDRFCSQCGAGTGEGPSAVAAQTPRLSRPASQVKIAGVCAGFARYFGVDVMLVRILWCVMTVWPLPLFGLIAYLVAWALMPRDPIALPAGARPAGGLEPANGPAA